MNTGDNQGRGGYFYTCPQNPVNDYAKARIAALKGGAAAMLTSSVQAANFSALFHICGCVSQNAYKSWNLN